jgi:hypothetical protein
LASEQETVSWELFGREAVSIKEQQQQQQRLLGTQREIR